MDARKPDLFDVLLLIVWRTKEILPEKSSAFINGYGVANDMEVGVVRRPDTRKMGNVIHPAHRTDRIPDSDEVRLTFSTECFLEVCRDPDVDVFLLDHSY